MAQELAKKRKRISEVIVIWPDVNLPPHLREMLDRVKYVYPGARAAAIKVRPDALPWVLGNLDKPLEDVPPMIRSLVGLMQRHNIRKLPALIVDGVLITTGPDVEDALRRIVHTPALV